MDPGACRSGVYSTSDSLIRRSPAHEIILVLLVWGINFAEKMFPMCPESQIFSHIGLRVPVSSTFRTANLS